MYKNKLVFVCLALLVISISVALQALQAPTTSGRVYKYEAFIKTYKEPEDPWDFWVASLSPDPHTDRSFGSLTVHGSNIISRRITLGATIHSNFDILTETRIVATFSFSATTTTKVYIGSEGGYEYIYIPTRTYYPGIQYRWIVTIPGYQSSDLIISPFVIPRSSTEFFNRLPLTVECLYWDGGQGVYSSTDLSISKTETRYNATHYLDVWTINFGNSWVGRSVSSCSIFTTNTYVISDLNSLLQNSGQRTITSGRLYLLMLSSLNIVVEQGDRIEVWVWFITTANL